jgi:hypothetical protein
LDGFLEQQALVEPPLGAPLFFDQAFFIGEKSEN